MAFPKEPFSKRFGARPKPARCKPNEVPGAARVKLVPLIDELRGKVLPGAYSLEPALFEAIGSAAW